ncbi:MAG: 6-hydroxymethylpterin diphosphokinase MptE-like protein [Nitrospirota bacterium]
MKQTRCLICRFDDAELLGQFPYDPYHRHLDHLKDVPATYVVCRNCSFVYTNPMLEPEELAVLYGEKLRPSRPDEAYLKANRKVYQRRYQWIANELGLPSQERPTPSILEVGCAAGVALSVFREYGWRTTGIEPADTFAAHARESFGLNVQTGFYGPGSFEGRQFDLIMFSQVLEHVPDPDSLLTQASRNLTDDGHIFIGVPTLMRPLRPVHPMTLQAVHLWIFSLPTLTALLERNGLEPVAHSYDAKGLLVLARKSSLVARHSSLVTASDAHHPSPIIVSDSAERVTRYFRWFTEEDSLYARNLAALKGGDRQNTRSPDLDGDLSTITVEQSPEGWLNLCERQGGRERRLYASDPREAARKLAGQLDPGIEGVVVVLGLGLGYLAAEILGKLSRGHVLILCEADPRVFRAAMFHQDLTSLFNDPRVHVIVGDDLARLDYVLGLSSKAMYVADKIHVVKCGASKKWQEDLYARMAERVQERMKVLEINRNTIGGLGLRMMANTLENAHLIMDMPGVARFEGLFKGLPAIVVSAGPSLEKNFHLLKEAKGRAVIIACDTVLRMLVPNGIVPDVTITADPHEATYRKFRDLPMDRDSILVCHPANYPDLFRTFNGRRFTTGPQLAIYRFLSRFWKPKGRIDHKTQSSAHLAFNFATLIGADPIIFIGQDLCYYDNKKHAGNLTKGSPFEAKGGLREHEPATDILGQPVETTVLFQSFKVILDDMVRESPARVINATEGGLGIKGAEVMTLKDAIASCCPPSPIGIAERFASVSGDQPDETDRRGLMEEVRRIHREARETLAVVRKMLTYVRRADRVIKRGKEDSARARYLSELAERQSRAMEGRQELMALLVEGAYFLELYMSREEVLAIDEIPDPKERFRKQIGRAMKYYTGLQQVLEPFCDGTGELLERLEELDRLKELPSRTVPERLAIANRLKRLMDYPRARDLYEEILKEEPEQMEALFHLGDILYRCHRPHEALPLLKRVAANNSSYMNVQDVIRRCREKADTWETKTGEAKAVMASVPALSEGEMALRQGQFYWRATNRERAKQKFARAMEAAPAQSDVYLVPARLFEEAGLAEEALAALERALTACPGEVWPLKALGLFALRYGQRSQAESFLLAAVQMDPNVGEEAGDALVQAGAFLAAGECYEQALARDPSNGSLTVKAAWAYQRATESSALALSGRQA